MYRSLLLITLLFSSFAGFAQPSIKVYGRITNAKMEPLAFASVQVKEFKRGVVTKEDGSFEIELDEGKFDLVISMIGYKTQVITVIMQKENYRLNVIMEEGAGSDLEGVTVKGKYRDKAEEYVRNVIRHKDSLQAAAGAYSCNVYIRAVQEDSGAVMRSKSPNKDTAFKTGEHLSAMTEIVMRLDRDDKRIKEERTGIKKTGNWNGLFYLSTTEGDFNFYNNLVNVPSVSPITFLSPLSYSGLLAYRFKTLKMETVNGRKIYTISVKPRQLSNATVEGEIKIMDSVWVLLSAKLNFPKYHLPEYDFFEVQQNYELVNGRAWMITKQQFIYNAASGKRKSSGQTTVTYKDFELNKQFDKKHFGTELSSATQQAYERDSSFWKANRTEPLTEKEVRFLNYKDSIYRATHTKAYLDSVDAVVNKITWQKILYKGQTFQDHEKQRRWFFPPLPNFYSPFAFGGARLLFSFNYNQTFKSRKNISLFTDLSYGFRNRDVNGSVNFNRMYNPFNRGFYSISLDRDFENIYEGDAWVNMLKRSNVYLKQGVGLGHGLEIKNGLFFYTNFDVSFRKSVAGYKTGTLIDSLLGGEFSNSTNDPLAFAPYNAAYGSIRFEYTPHQKYIREPKEKVILGSSWPTLYVSWRKGLPGLFNSKVDFDYLEFGIKQSARLGVMGTSSYTIKTGSFISKKDLRLVDYKFIRRGDPGLFLNPNEAFQSMDSTFPVFKRFYEGHLLHEFNGALLNKIPFFKKIGLREVAGAGFLIADERHLRYGELFTGIERVFKYPFSLLGKFKLGFYVVGSVANQFRNPVQFKFGITSWDRKKGKWF